mmetsp:Transcript_52395/g.59889  ORF Transcript_52395/g.59889 Transcript_52395/m.59889 type:complete len:562 (+) Transcript_52395:96-1781(+)
MLSKLFRKLTGRGDDDNNNNTNNVQYQQQQGGAPNVPQARNVDFDRNDFANDDEVVEWTGETSTSLGKGNDDVPPLTLKFSSLYDPINLKKVKKELPCVLSLQAASCNIDDDKKRSPVDIICVIDRSGSMSGDPIEMVKDTLGLIVESIGENDRLCLIEFASHASRLTTLKRMTKDGKDSVQRVVDSISAGGGTNISTGIDLALKVLKGRKYSNPISSILVLSDGQDNQGGTLGRVESLLRTHDLQDSFTINSFGYGSSHDADVLNGIATAKDGVFHFIEQMDNVYDAFADCLGSLLTTVAGDVKVRIEACRSATFPKLAVSKVFMDQKWLKKVNRDPARYEVSYKQILAETSKDIVFILDTDNKKEEEEKLEAINEENEESTKEEENEEEEEEVKNSDSCNVVKVECEYNALSLDGGRKLITQTFVVNTFTGSIFRNGEPKNLDVLRDYYRVKVAEAIKEAQALAEDNNLDKARENLTALKTEIEKSEVKNDEKIKHLLRDLDECKNRMVSATTYQNVGKAWCHNVGSSHYAQESTILTAQYCNTGQERFRSVWAAKKKY